MCPHRSISLIKNFLRKRYGKLSPHTSYCILPALLARFSGSHGWQCRFVKILQMKKRGAEACNLHSAITMHKAKSWEVLLRAWRDYVRVGLHDIYFCIKIDLKAKGGYTNLYFHAIISLLCTFLRGRCKLTCHHLKANRSLARLHRVSLEPKERSFCFRGMWQGRYTGGVAVTILGQNTVKSTL